MKNCCDLETDRLLRPGGGGVVFEGGRGNWGGNFLPSAKSEGGKF